MGTNYVPLICYYDGELQHSTGGPNYVGGHIRADRISKDISFVGFVTKMHELCKSPSGEAIIDVKCRYLIDQQTSIAMHVEDDTSLSVIMDSYPNQCNAIVVYIEKMPAEKSNTTSKRHDEGSSSFGDGQVTHMSDTAVEMNGNQYSSNDFDYSESLVIDLDHRESMESSTSTRSFEMKREYLKSSLRSNPGVSLEECDMASIAIEHLEHSAGPEDYSPYAHSSPPWQFLPNDHVRSTKSCLGMTICDPRDPYCQKWNKAFLISCMVALALDALFFYAPTIDGKRNCLGSDMRMELIVCVLRSVIDAVYVLHINFRFHTGFYDHTTDKIVVDRKEICKRYLSSFFLIDILAVLPLPQVLFLLVLPVMRGSINVSRRNSLRYAVLLQYFPRSLRIYPLYKLLREGNTMIKTAWAGAIFNFSLYMLASHIFGACWYFLSVQRETICWWQACSETTTCNHSSLYCGDSDAGQNAFLFATCQANTTVFDYGIYRDALQSGIVDSSFLQKLIYCFWWGLQNLGSFGQNLKTSSYVWEVLFVVSTSLFGLFLFMLVIGNVQTYLRSDTVKTEIEIRKRLRDTEQWMSRYSVPENLKQRIRQNELSMRKRSRGLDDENMLRHIPEDLKRDIKRHLRIGLLRRVPLVEIMDKKVVDALCDHLKYVFYTNGCIIMRSGEPVEELFFVLRGKLRCSTTISKRTGLSSQWHMRSGDFCGEELLTWAFTENSKPISTQNIQALDEVEGFVLKAYDLKCLVTEFDLLRNKDIQPILRVYSPEWRIWAAYYIQAAWSEYREMKLKEHLRVAPNDRSHIHELRRLMKKKPAKVPVKPQFHTAAD